MHNPDYEQQDQQPEQDEADERTTEAQILKSARCYNQGAGYMNQELLALGVQVVDRSSITAAEFGAWLHNTDFQQFEKTITLTSPNQFMAQWVRNKFAGTLAKISGKKINIAVRQ